MYPANKFIRLLKNKGFNFFTGVPCSIIKNIILSLEKDQEVSYIPGVREDQSIGVAAGAYLAKKSPVVLMQNNGLGNCLDVLTSLNLIYKIPVLIIMTWRGYAGKDFPEHIIIGKANLSILKEVGIPFFILAEDNLEITLEQAKQKINSDKIPVVLMLKKGIIC